MQSGPRDTHHFLGSNYNSAQCDGSWIDAPLNHSKCVMAKTWQTLQENTTQSSVQSHFRHI